MTNSSRTCAGFDSQILECLRRSRTPLSAYQIREAVGSARPSSPVVVYRALQRLIDRGLVHRVASLRAFVACGLPQEAHSPVLSVCLICRTVREAPLGGGRLGLVSMSLGMDEITPDRVEVHIRCQFCRSST